MKMKIIRACKLKRERELERERERERERVMNCAGILVFCSRGRPQMA